MQEDRQGQELPVGAYQALMRQMAVKRMELFARHEMLDLVTICMCWPATLWLLHDFHVGTESETELYYPTG
jgi:hypothetical protein